MELKVVVPPPPPSLNLFNMNMNMDMDMNRNCSSSSNCSTPYISAPSSPQRPLNFFYSAPPSPRRFSGGGGRVPPSSTAAAAAEEGEEDFEFEFSGQLDMMIRPSLSSADELFDGGKIRPLKPPPIISTVDSPRSPISKFRDALSPKQRKKKSDEDNTTKFEAEIPLKFNDQIQTRSRSKNLSNSRESSRKGISRSLSPLRVSEFPKNPDRNPNSNGGSSSSRWGSRKWRLKDFLLFRSASEGNGNDPLRKKYFSLYSKKADEGSFRSTTSSSSMADGSVSRRRGQVSAHELHYTANRAVTEEMKKKTSLPYKHGLLGCLGFNPAFHDISKAFGSFARS